MCLFLTVIIVTRKLEDNYRLCREYYTAAERQMPGMWAKF